MKKIFFFIIILNSAVLTAQKKNICIGGGLGLGSLMGNFPSLTTLGSKLYFESASPLSVFNKLQFHFSFGQKIEKFLPNSYENDYYAYFTSFGLSGILNQPLNEVLFIEEGFGLIYLNDRSFNDIDSWNFGIIISLAGGMPISNKIDLTVNIDYGITLNNTNASYFIFMVNGKYYL